VDLVDSMDGVEKNQFVWVSYHPSSDGWAVAELSRYLTINFLRI